MYALKSDTEKLFEMKSNYLLDASGQRFERTFKMNESV